MSFRPGDFVERRNGYGVARFGRIGGPIRRDGDSWYVSIGNGLICTDYGVDLRPLLETDDLAAFGLRRTIERSIGPQP